MKQRLFAFVLAVTLTLLTGCGAAPQTAPAQSAPAQSAAQSAVQGAAQSAPTSGTPATGGGAEDDAFSLEDLPAYDGSPYIAVHDNVPYFTEEELTEESYESYAPLDDLGRCGAAMASIGRDLMPTESRGSIGQVKPTGWQTAKYDFVDGKYLYNRCHLIGFQLTGENANECNLITGTRAMNVDGMLPFENMVADYVKETDNHVLYRVTPIFVGSELVARGVLMEGKSVEDGGEGVEFCVYAYNNQPGVEIDYATGESSQAPAAETGAAQTGAEMTYVLNTSSKKFHLPTCSGIADIKPDNRADYTGTREDVVAAGYAPCGRCKP